MIAFYFDMNMQTELNSQNIILHIIELSPTAGQRDLNAAMILYPIKTQTSTRNQHFYILKFLIRFERQIFHSTVNK